MFNIVADLQVAIGIAKHLFISSPRAIISMFPLWVQTNIFCLNLHIPDLANAFTNSHGGQV